MAAPELRDQVASLPRSPGVYLWKDAAGTVLYVGKAVDLRSRAGAYLQEPQAPKTAHLMAEAAGLDFIAVHNEKEALVLEQTLIKRHRPRYNVRLTDDKQYPYLHLTGDRYPRLVKVHGRRDESGDWFGPFPDGYGAFHVLAAMNDLLPLRRCKTLPKEKCLYFDIGKCIAPCIGACTDEEYAAVVREARDLLSGRADGVVTEIRERMEAAAEAHRFEEAARLRDQVQGLLGALERQNMVHGKLEDRDVAAIEAEGDAGVVVLLHQRGGKIVDQSPFTVAGAGGRDDGDVLADFLRGYYQDRPVPRHLAVDLDSARAAALEADLRLLVGGPVTVDAPQKGDKRRWVEVAKTNARLRLEQEKAARSRRGQGALEALQTALGLDALPRVIEGFDVSHRAGEFTRAALVRFVDGEPHKAGYRTFNMRTVGQAAVAAGIAPSRGAGREVDDYASIHEAVSRRYRGLLESEEALPDLVLIDGGPGQLAAARDALAAVGAGHLATCSLAKAEEEAFVPGRLRPLRLRRDDSALQLLQRVRDEAHRFGITQVRRKAVAAALASPLDAVAGIGPKRRAELVKAFGGLEGLRAASVEDLMRVPGVTRERAEAVAAALRNEG